MSTRSRAALRLVNALDVEGEVIDGVRFFDVVGGDGTHLRAWTNDLDGSLARDPRVPTVLLCNGLGANAWCFPRLLATDAGVRVISWNHRGTGGSARPADPTHVGIEHFVDDAVAVMDHCGLDSAPVMGWSMGVNTAFELATRHPERVSGIFAVAGVPGRTFSTMLEPLHVPRFLREAITVNAARVMGVVGGPVSPLLRRITLAPWAADVVAHTGFMLPGPDLDNAARALTCFLRTPVDWYMHLAVTTSRHQRVSLSTIDVPTTFVAGSYDMLAGATDMFTASRRMADADYVEYRASHFVAMELPDEVHGHLLEWLERVG